MTPQERALLKNVLGAARIARRRRDGSPRRHHRRARWTRACARCSRCFAPPAIRACRSMAIRSTIRAAWCISAISSITSRNAPKRAATPPRARATFPSRRSTSDAPLVAGECVEAGAVRAALHAGARSARADAGDAHPYGAGHRRIWRHRRPRVDRGHRGNDRRRHRGRARHRRVRLGSKHSASGVFLVDGKRRSRRGGGSGSASISVSRTRRRKSRRSAGSSTWLAGRVPIRGEIVPAPVEGFEFEIVDADPRRIGKLRVRASTAKEDAGAQE